MWQLEISLASLLFSSSTLIVSVSFKNIQQYLSSTVSAFVSGTFALEVCENYCIDYNKNHNYLSSLHRKNNLFINLINKSIIKNNIFNRTRVIWIIGNSKQGKMNLLLRSSDHLTLWFNARFISFFLDFRQVSSVLHILFPPNDIWLSVVPRLLSHWVVPQSYFRDCTNQYSLEWKNLLFVLIFQKTKVDVILTFIPACMTLAQLLKTWLWYFYFPAAASGRKKVQKQRLDSCQFETSSIVVR